VEGVVHGPVLANVGQGTSDAAVADAQKICVFRLLAELCEKGYGIEAGAIVVDHALDSL
jgi:hypothetical protein